MLPQSDTGRETVDGLLGRSESVGLLLHCKYPAVNCDFCVMHLAWLLRAALTVMTVESMHSHADGHWMPDQKLAWFGFFREAALSHIPGWATAYGPSLNGKCGVGSLTLTT